MTDRRSFLAQAAATFLAGASPAAEAERQSSPRIKASRDGAAAKAGTQNSPGTLRFAIVGTGQISHRYLKQGAEISRVRFVATCARTMESAKNRAIEYGIESWFDDYSSMLDIARPDAVVIATPTALHAPQAIAALARGVHVICEKPMALSLEQCKAMNEASIRSGKVLLCMPFNSTPQMKAAAAHLTESTLGFFTGAEAQLLVPGVSRDNWYYDKKIAGGGAGLDSMVYPVSRLVTLLGPAKRVSGFINTLIPKRLLGNGETVDVVPPSRNSTKEVESTVDDNASLLIEWQGGQQAIARALWGTSIVRNDTVIYGRHGTLWLSGSEVIVHSPERQVSGAKRIEWNGQSDCYTISYNRDQKTEGIIEHFLDCIDGSSQSAHDRERQLHVHEIVFRGYDSAHSGRTQELETTFKPLTPMDPLFHDSRGRRI